MTCIVGVVKGNTVWLGGDRAATDGALDRMLIKEPKVFVRDELGFGVCGEPKVMDALQHAIELPKQAGGNDKGFIVSEVVPTIRDGLKKLDAAAEHHGQLMFHGAILVAYRARLYRMECNFQIVEAGSNFDSVGSGGPHALGSLQSTKDWRNPRKRVLEALRVAAENNAGVAPPFDVITVKKRG